MHGNLSQNQRERALAQFESGRVSTLVATDVAARGLDVDDITHVINFDPPHGDDDYVHRIGRTGRAGRNGNGVTFVLPEQRNDVGRLAARLGHGEQFAASGASPALAPDARQRTARPQPPAPAPLEHRRRVRNAGPVGSSRARHARLGGDRHRRRLSRRRRRPPPRAAGGDRAAARGRGDRADGARAALRRLLAEDTVRVVRDLGTMGLVAFAFARGAKLDRSHLPRAHHFAAWSRPCSGCRSWPGSGSRSGCTPGTTWSAARRSRAAFLLFVGAAISITAFPVLARIIEEHGLVGTASAPSR